MKRIFSLLFCLSLLLATSVSAQEDAQDTSTNGISLTATAGFDGYYKSQFWVPVTIDVSNTGAAIDGTLQVIVTGTNQDDVVYESAVSLPTQAEKRITTYIYKEQGALTNLRVQLINSSDDLIATTRTNALRGGTQDRLLYGVVSSEVGEMAYLEDIEGGRTRADIAYFSLNQLPDLPTAWSSLDILIFNNVDTGKLTPAQKAALTAWIDGGGQLIVTGGPNWQQTSAGVTDLLPVTINGSDSISALPQFEAFGEAPFRLTGNYVVATSSLKNGATALANEGQLPLLTKTTQGRGTVYFLALDTQLAPLNNWDGNLRLWETIANATPELPYWGLGAQNTWNINNAVSYIPSRTLPHPALIAAVLGVYILLIGPINYFVLKRRNRKELAWLTIPAIILLFTIGTYIAGYQLRGRNPIINQLSVMYGREGSEMMRTQTLLGLYSPARKSYDLQLDPSVSLRPLTGDQYSGSNNQTGLASIDRGSSVTAKDIRVDVSGVSPLIAESFQVAPDIIGDATLNLDGNAFSLDVSITNNSETTFDSASVMFNDRAHALGAIPAGETISTGFGLTGSAGESAVSSLSGSIIPATSSSYYGGGPPTLEQNCDILLGVADCWNSDQQARYGLLQAIQPDYNSSRTTTVPRGIVTLFAWSDEAQIDATVLDHSPQQLATTLYIIELPFKDLVATGSNVTVPASFMTFEPLGNSNVYEQSPEYLYLTNGWIEFEFKPWEQYATMDTTALSVTVDINEDFFESPPPPDVTVWDWQQKKWIDIEMDEWGTVEVANPDPYIGANNAVRIRVEDSSGIQRPIRAIYPTLTGDIN